MEIATRSIQLSYPFIDGEGGRTRTCNLGFRKPVLVISSEIPLSLVGMRGFEPPVPCPPDRCSNQTEPHPDVLLVLMLWGFLSKGEVHVGADRYRVIKLSGDGLGDERGRFPNQLRQRETGQRDVSCHVLGHILHPGGDLLGVKLGTRRQKTGVLNCDADVM